MADKQFPEGIRIFERKPNAPEFVGDDIVLEVAPLISWLQKQKTEKVRLQILRGKTGKLYIAVNDYQAQQQAQPKPYSQPAPTASVTNDPGDDLPF